VDNDPAGPVSPADQAKFREFDHVDPSEAVKVAPFAFHVLCV
jgi:hypothetical protein